jgi:partner of Y14 and mago protein
MSKPQPSTAGIIVAKETGERVVAPTRRADGSLRKEIKIRPGYTPPEDVARYANSKVESFKAPDGYVVGLGVVEKNKTKTTGTSAAAQESEKSKAAKKNEKRRAAAKAKDGEDIEAGEIPAPVEKKDSSSKSVPTQSSQPAQTPGEAPDEQKQLRNLKKKLGQAKELEQKKADGGSLLPEQQAKIAKLPELETEIAELEKKLAGVKV